MKVPDNTTQVEYKYQSIYEITYNCLIKLLADGSAEC